jgi:KDO2-lipid IV(A) lauroyltransferase
MEAATLGPGSATVELLMRGISSLANLLPERSARALGRGIGRFAFHVIRFRRPLVERNLELAFDLPHGHPQIRALARDNFVHYGHLLIELLRLRRVVHGELDQVVRFEGLENLEWAYDQGRGVLGLTAHLGNYDLMACAVARRGYPLTIVSKPLRNKGVERAWMTEREASGLQVCLSRYSMREILRALRANRLVGFVLDQHARVDGVWVDFFGRPASTLRSLAALAARTEAPVVPFFARRCSDGLHEIEVRPALDLETVGDKDANILHNTQLYTRMIEDAVRETPSQWTWIHRRWKTPPAG